MTKTYTKLDNTTILRENDGVFIPIDDGNSDYIDYQISKGKIKPKDDTDVVLQDNKKHAKHPKKRV